MKHLKLIENKDLVEIGMLPLERKRCLDKLANEFCASVSAAPSSKGPSHTVHMPSTSYGHSVIDVNEKDLLRHYGSLYYESPRNVKQKMTNEFILNMCSSSRWRFSNKSDYEQWAREERRARSVSLIAFADASDVTQETNYYKDQCFMYQLHDLQREYADLEKLSQDRKEDITEQVIKQKKDRLGQYNAKLQKLCEDAKHAAEGVNQSWTVVSGKQGRKEEELFWGGQKKKAETVLSSVEKVVTRMCNLQETFHFDKTMYQRVEQRKKTAQSKN